MALGSSAPEILLSIIETLLTLDNTPGELGPSTIVGSAAFNLLVISGISILAVKTPEIKKVDDTGVFLITSVWSVFAYVWMYICLSLWTPEIITIEEGVITLIFFVLLVVTAFGADRYRAYKIKKNQGDTLQDDTNMFNMHDFQHVLKM